MSRLRPSIGMVVAATFTVCACSLSSQHGYAQSADGTLSFRYPADWQDVDLEPAGLEWVTGIDASAQPSPSNAKSPVSDAPFVVAQVYELRSDVRDDASLRSLRLLSLADRPDPAEVEDPSIRLVFEHTFLDDGGFEGHRMRLEVDSDEGTSVEEHLAVFTPDRSKVQRLWITCSIACFATHSADIDDVFDSVRLRP